MDDMILGARRKLARRLKMLRKRKGWTQQKMAERADIDIRHVQRLESTKKTPAIEIDTIVKISSAFNISPSKLIDF